VTINIYCSFKSIYAKYLNQVILHKNIKPVEQTFSWQQTFHLFYQKDKLLPSPSGFTEFINLDI